MPRKWQHQEADFLDSTLTIDPSVSDAIAKMHDVPWVVSHRGEWHSLPENSIEAALHAFQIGADMVEIDVQCIADNTLVVIHDDTLDRTTNARGPVKDLTATELAQTRLRASDGERDSSLTDIRLPRLAEMLEELRGKCMINLDTKLREELDDACDLVVDLKMEDQVLMKMLINPSADGSEFLNCSWFGKVPFMPVILDAPRGQLAQIASRVVGTLKSPIVEVQFQTLEDLEALSAQMAASGTQIWTNTLDPVHSLNLSDSNAMSDPELVWGALLDAGVRAIQTDQSESLRKYLERRLTK